MGLTKSTSQHNNAKRIHTIEDYNLCKTSDNIDEIYTNNIGKKAHFDTKWYNTLVYKQT